MKKLYLALALSCFSVNALALTEGVIVHDAKSAIDTASQWVKEAKQWQKELTAYKAKTGIRDVQGLVQDAQSVSKELTDIYEQGNSFIEALLQS
ncbi:hypothetical protein [Salmonella enterica]|uniref:hypothetical protein n=1 Tax=Salmonella enterica TaxID=28901 RepID=UPI0015E6145A|nr:hypothetical protein [Salmonella enterica]